MQPVRRALDILSSLAGEGSGKTLVEISRELEIPASSIHRFMAVLEEKDFAIRTEGLRYILGPAARALVSKPSTELIRDATAPVLRSLSRQQGETAFLAQMVGSDVICIDYVEGTRPLRHHVHVGTKLPLNAASSARAILSQLDERDVDELLNMTDFTAYTENSITTAEELKVHLRGSCAAGYDICDNEMENHMWAVSAPLFSSEGAVPYAVTIVAPLSSVESSQRREVLVAAVKEASERISGELGANLTTAGMAGGGPRSTTSNRTKSA
ncbi:IclR family transcriptional regulator (plasmid) [Arthrobacter sp. UC242_113]|uniref:IclR family transcriptional regulator n=1 Tax=Arthrobacter sp. UC242_113 TaxID=3374550 RepID=UPI0037564A89